MTKISRVRLKRWITDSLFVVVTVVIVMAILYPVNILKAQDVIYGEITRVLGSLVFHKKVLGSILLV